MYQVNILLKLHFFYAEVQNNMQTSIDISLMQTIVARFRLNTQKVINLLRVQFWRAFLWRFQFRNDPFQSFDDS